MSDEVARAVERAEAMLEHTDEGELDVRLIDAVANLLILAYERDVNTADVVMKGAAHWLATYAEPMRATRVEQFLTDALFPWTGDRQFAEYIAERAILLAGKEYRVAVPEWGV